MLSFKEYLTEGLMSSLFGKKPKPDSLDIKVDGYGDEKWVKITVNGEDVGNFVFKRVGKDLRAEEIWLKPKFRGRDFAKMAYDALKKSGFTVRRSDDQTALGAKFWNKNRPGSVTGDPW